jgi:hypothetical protein
VAKLDSVGLLLGAIYNALVAYRGFDSFVRSNSLPRCDFFVSGSPSFIVEYDERQHFTKPRLITLDRVPAGYKLGFEIAFWRRECERIQARDNDPPYRDEQRAWYDVLRDIMPPALGMGGTVRIRDASSALCSIDLQDSRSVEAFGRLVTPA